MENIKIQKNTGFVNFIKRHSALFLSLGISLLMAIVYWVIITPMYTNKDDPMMSTISYGYFGSYDEHLIFINVIIGYILKGLMSIIPGLPWYTILQGAVVLSSFTICLYLIFKTFKGFTSACVAAVVVVSFGYSYMSTMQFTQTAGIATIAGLLLMFHAFATHRSWGVYVLGAVFAVIGSLYRFVLFESILVPFAGLGLYFLIKSIKQKSFKEILRLLLPFALMLAVCFTFQAVNKQAYTSPEWDVYKQYNSVRSKLLDYGGYPDYSENTEVYDSLNLSENDLISLKYVLIGDSEVLSKETMEKLLDLKTQTSEGTNLISGLKEIAYGYMHYTFFPALVFAVILFLLKFDLKKLFIVIWQFLSVAGMNAYLVYRGRYLLDRVDISMVLAPTMIIFLYCCRTHFVKAKKAVAAGLAAIALVQPMILTIRGNDKYKNKIPRNQTACTFFDLVATDKPHFYINCVRTVYDYQPFYVKEEGYYSNIFTLDCWLTSSPMMNKIYGEYDIENPFRDVSIKDYTYLAIDHMVFDTLNYIKKQYNPDAEAYCVKTIKGYGKFDINIYKITDKELQLDTDNAVPCTPDIHFDTNVSNNRGRVTVTGSIYKEGANSYTSNVYIGVKSSDGKETFYYANQYGSETQNDLMNGLFGSFSCCFFKDCNEHEVTLYLETDGTLYKTAVN